MSSQAVTVTRSKTVEAANQQEEEIGGDSLTHRYRDNRCEDLHVRAEDGDNPVPHRWLDDVNGKGQEEFREFFWMMRATGKHALDQCPDLEDRCQAAFREVQNDRELMTDCKAVKSSPTEGGQ